MAQRHEAEQAVSVELHCPLQVQTSTARKYEYDRKTKQTSSSGLMKKSACYINM